MKRLGSPVEMMLLGAAVMVIALLLGRDTQGQALFYVGTAVALAGGVWWLVRGHIAEHRRKQGGG
ncbi:hypothetical protein FB554_1360 [Barrientosiimonas humi]|uniref:Uncharacterized protein n=1 Tax=Barrientosiimonas humi TaxID=999931 RepID=A0A542XBK4_9MICO|nr:hypothetical protein [Barrientosiimonas humi]TQL33222.1 hypothetical protein FB554_1360 [Barrientosiimonas humi]CAG7573211.1 hypothetical protein BH39T_PBIAJDOK_01838 [Barrientosiimonas humi]